MHYNHLRLDTISEHVALITLQRENAANALNQALAEEITHVYTAISADKSIRCIVLTGAGERAFSAGADLKERKGMSEEQWHTQHHALEAALRAVITCPKPVIAAVNGAAMGGGLELALACDFIYASENTRFGLTEATLGIMPGMGGTQTLPRAIGAQKAKEMLFTGKPMSAEQALAYGLVNQLFPPAALLQETLKTAASIAANAPLAVASIKQSVIQGAEKPLDEALTLELNYYNRLLKTNDRSEGINAFNEKRKPLFSGS